MRLNAYRIWFLRAAAAAFACLLAQPVQAADKLAASTAGGYARLLFSLEPNTQVKALVAGEVKWPRADDEIRLFKNNVGLGSQFAAVGGLVLAKAREAGLGFKVPQELVSQLMRR